jgi:hypothetical protein
LVSYLRPTHIKNFAPLWDSNDPAIIVLLQPWAVNSKILSLAGNENSNYSLAACGLVLAEGGLMVAAFGSGIGEAAGIGILGAGAIEAAGDMTFGGGTIAAAGGAFAIGGGVIAGAAQLGKAAMDKL